MGAEGAWGAEGQAELTERGMGLNVGGGICGIEHLEAEQGEYRESLGWGWASLMELFLSRSRLTIQSSGCGHEIAPT